MKRSKSGNPNRYWTKERCIEDAKKYETRSAWRKNSPGAYNFARRNNFLGECFSDSKSITHKPMGYWTKERCIEDAKKYDMRSEWQNKSVSAYRIAHKNNWLKECFTHMVSRSKPKGYWTKERCIEDGKKYHTRTEWFRKSGSAYTAARKNEWLNDCIKQFIKK